MKEIKYINQKKYLVAVAILIHALIISCTSTTEGAPEAAPEGNFAVNQELGNIQSVQMNGATIYRFLGTDEAAVASYVIETQNALVLIDVQNYQSRAKEVRRFIESLEKPVERVIITQSYSYHYMGLNVFDDYPTYSTAQAKEVIAVDGERIRVRGANDPNISAEFPKNNTLPKNILESSFEVDGIVYEVVAYEDANAHSQIIIKVPSLGAVFTADLIEKEGHLVVVNSNEYLEALEDIKALEGQGYNTIFAMHGSDLQLKFSDIAAVEEYVKTVQKLVANKPDRLDYLRAIEKAYPNYGEANYEVYLMSQRKVFKN